jgi:hypothetical protein
MCNLENLHLLRFQLHIIVSKESSLIHPVIFDSGKYALKELECFNLKISDNASISIC